MERIACIYLPEWPIQRLIVQQPELRCQKVVLFVQHPQRGQIVACASPLAARSGVRIGMPVTEAKSLLRVSSQPSPTTTGEEKPKVHLFPYEPSVDRAALEDLARQLDSFSPSVGLDTEEEIPSSLLLNVTGLAHLFGGEETLLHSIHDYLRQLGYLVQAAIGPTLGTAWALAHEKRGQASFSDLRHAMIAPSLFSWSVLDHLPPCALRIDSATCETLSQLGLDSIADLRRIPAESLTARFGDTISRRLHQAAGIQNETFRSVPRSATYQAEQLLEFPVRDQATVLVVIERLIKQVCGELKQIRQGALAWHIRLWRQQASPLHLRVGLFQASSRTDQIMPLVKMQLEQDRSFDGENFPVEEVSVSAGGCVLLVERQGQLFDEQPRKNEAALGGLLNRLAIRLGEDQVVSAVCVSGAQPERAVEYRPLVGPRSIRPRRSSRLTTGDTMERPLRLLPEPIALKKIEPLALQSSGCSQTNLLRLPDTFEVEDQIIHITRSWGPERVETGWWHGRTIRRDYWRIETNTGAQLWIYHDLRWSRWFLHGGF